ncbi:30S ribosomal protein S4 [Candidatus Kuenenbacteria bacterium CG11_big_fil_rev_8_21_14_0_20_37_9]|uniref:Small ribosomal subunit protein uS4 n=2 Tax=Candidatus Kueneniibacteriota TaxID=1752740 RepID=A0A2M6XSA8_9BACT|nr:MAG: 30S ribosomal protein S4 [Candidatus Kuenenbacteria bacterium CG1_02_38_13]PIR05714.1 MAG: 30S ribosomal protein S4 [Candidatus Kuenenbacteria bacterium CG11_big_fil_rev_8_21_14_0_20_37_9]PIU10517.1 MAG: 30S ribosomal protein S4 [Candidatus Kuenenbacteria bacterium CG08_land_8_20_14_0_20_37_23]
MGRNLDPKCKQCRRFGEKLFLKGERCFGIKCAMVKKNYLPGLHGQKGFRRESEYAKQLQAKQKAKKIFRIQEKQFQNYFTKAGKMKGNISINLLTLLEKRLDNVIYRIGLAESRDKARQLVSHAHFYVNGKKVNIPSYELKEKDEITVREKSKSMSVFGGVFDNIKSSNIPEWLDYDGEKQIAKVVGEPGEKDFDQAIDARLIVEFYSR